MREITIYCSARDQEISVLVDHDPLYEDETSVLDSTLYCLEIGHACIGTTCPLGAEPPTSLDPAWLARMTSSPYWASATRRAIRRNAEQGGLS
jgi:hypothetical protein